MKQFISFIKKEWKHIIRDKKTLLILFITPIVQLLILGFALSNEVKNINIAVFDLSNDLSSKNLISKINGNKYFTVSKFLSSESEINDILKQKKVKSVLVIPENFNEGVVNNLPLSVQIISDSSDPNLAKTAYNYIETIVMQFQRENKNNQVPLLIQADIRMLYNPQQLGAYNFVPGVMTMILMLLCTMMTSVSIVKEKETGTMEMLLISPVNPILIIISKTIPYLFLSIVNVLIILLISTSILEVPIRGNILLLLFTCIIFIVTCLSLGLLISNVTQSQQSALLSSLVGMFLPTVIFSGFMFPLENMPFILQVISKGIPSKWFYDILKEVMIKGGGIETIIKPLIVLISMLIVFSLISIRKFKKTVL